MNKGFSKSLALNKKTHKTHSPKTTKQLLQQQLTKKQQNTNKETNKTKNTPPPKKQKQTNNSNKKTQGSSQLPEAIITGRNQCFYLLHQVFQTLSGKGAIVSLY